MRRLVLTLQPFIPPNEDLFREDEGRQSDNAADQPDRDDYHEVHHLAGLRGEWINNHLT